MDKPLVTVLMPVFNAEKFLRKAIESILAQTFTSFEFLIIDDASSDESVKIIESFNDERIRLVRNERNMGISATLNLGIDLAIADWIARMDADDISHPSRLQKQFVHCLGHPDTALFSSWVRIINENGKLISLSEYNSKYYYYNINFECWIYHPTMFYNKSAVQAIGKYTVPYSEDFELAWQLSRKFKINNISEILLDYRISSTSLHQVIRKTEYDKAQEEQVKRNLTFYCPDLVFSNAELECLRHNFNPLLTENRVNSILKCLKKLDLVNRAIMEKENVNWNYQNIKEASFFKKQFIVLYFARNLSKSKAVWLLLRLKAWKYLTQLGLENLKRMIGQDTRYPGKH